MRVLIGDATRPEGNGPKVLAHVCNDLGLWGAGFVRAVSRRWRGPERDYRKAFEAGALKLGTVRFVEVGDALTVANMIAMRGVRRGNGMPLRYPALRAALAEVGRFARERKASVHMPRIGCGLAGGSWEEVEPIVQATLDGLPITVYDLA